MNDVIVGFCPFCGREGFICPAREQGSERIFFVCDECLNTFGSIEDMKDKKVQHISSAYSELTLQQALDAGLGKFVMRFDGKEWVHVEPSTESQIAVLHQDKESDQNGDLQSIREYLSSLGMREDTRNVIMKRIEKYSDIVSEFACRITRDFTPSPSITVCIGEKTFSADSLMSDYKRIDSLHAAYSYLAFLRDDPDCAVKLLKRGLPIK